MRSIILFTVVLFESYFAIEYNGVSVGEFVGGGVEGEVFLVNATHLQIIDFKISKPAANSLVVLSANNQKGSLQIFQHHSSRTGEWLEELGSLGSNHQRAHTRLVLGLTAPVSQWKQFAVVDPNGNILASVNLNQKPPQPFCCFESEADMGLFGEHGIISDPIEILDSRTLKIPKFSYKASETPDGYFFAGTGAEINQNSGIKAAIVGKDSSANSCPMLKDITDQTMIVRLDRSQTIYDIEWISVFCYKYSHDFGHLDIGLVENEEQVPPYIPDVRTSEPPRFSANC